LPLGSRARSRGYSRRGAPAALRAVASIRKAGQSTGCRAMRRSVKAKWSVIKRSPSIVLSCRRNIRRCCAAHAPARGWGKDSARHEVWTIPGEEDRSPRATLDRSASGGRTRLLVAIGRRSSSDWCGWTGRLGPAGRSWWQSLLGDDLVLDLVV